MKRSVICAVGLFLAGSSLSARTPDAEIVLQNDGAVPVFAHATDNNTEPPTTSVLERLDPGVGTTVPVDLDGDGNYYVTWIATDPVDPPTKSATGTCRGARDAICSVDLAGATPLPPQAPAAPPAKAPKP